VFIRKDKPVPTAELSILPTPSENSAECTNTAAAGDKPHLASAR